MLFTKFALLRVLLLTLPFSGISRPVPTPGASTSRVGRQTAWARSATTLFDRWIESNHCPTDEELSSLSHKGQTWADKKVLMAPGVKELKPVNNYSVTKSIVHVSPSDVFTLLSPVHVTKLETVCGADKFTLLLWKATLNAINPKELSVYYECKSSVGKEALAMARGKFVQRGSETKTKVFKVEYTHSEYDDKKKLKYGYNVRELTTKGSEEAEADPPPAYTP